MSPKKEGIINQNLESRKSLFDQSVNKFDQNLDKINKKIEHISITTSKKIKDEFTFESITSSKEEEKKSPIHIQSKRTEIIHFYDNPNFTEICLCGDCFAKISINEDFCKKCYKAFEKPRFTSIIYLINVNNKIEKHFIELISNEIFFYEDESKEICTKILPIDSYFFTEREPIYFEEQKQVFPIEFRSRNSFIYICMPNENCRKEFKQYLSSFVNFKTITDFYDIKELIGMGSYSKVYRANHKTKNFECAIKVISKSKMSSAELEILMNEI